MTRIELNAEKRDIFRKKLNKARIDGKLPAVVYGPKVKPVSIFVPFIDFKKVFKEAGESTVVDLKLDNKPLSVLIQEVAIDPVSREPLHIDFYAAEMNKPVEANIPLEFIGISPAVKSQGGVLVKVMHQVEVEALPANLPHNFKIDLSVLANLGDHITASQIIIPAGVKLITKGDEIIVIAESPKEEIVGVEKTIEDIEVEKKGKKEEVESEEVE